MCGENRRLRHIITIPRIRVLLRRGNASVILNNVRRLARLALFFSLGFVILFLFAAGMRFLAIRLEWIKTLSRQGEAILTELIAAARWALSFSLYGGILAGLSYSVRKKIAMPAALLCVGLLGLGFVCGASIALDSWEQVPPETRPAQLLGGPGLILANSRQPSSAVMVLLEGEPNGARVMAIPGKPLEYQAEYAGKDPSLVSLPAAPFEDNSPWFLKSLAIDLRLNAEKLRQLFNAGLGPFLLYTGALIFLLCSLSFILKFSAWPLLSLCLGCLTFRGVLALEIFVNSREMQDVFDSFLRDRLPLPLAVPLIFCGIGIVACLYSFLVYLAKRQGERAA